MNYLFPLCFLAVYFECIFLKAKGLVLFLKSDKIGSRNAGLLKEEIK